MFIKTITKLLLFLFFFLIVFFAQDKNAQNDSPKVILVKIQNSFEEGDVSKIAPYLSGKTYLSISEEISGYFSYSQSYNLLKDYFEVYKPLSFRFASRVDSAASPFAWGEYKFMKKGVRGSHKIFVSLQKNEARYFISQITIN